MSDDPFNVDEPTACGGGEVDAAVDEALETVMLSEDKNLEEIVLSHADSSMQAELLKIAKQFHLKENDPSWLFAYIFVKNHGIAETVANNTAIAANQAQHAVMKRFEEDSSQIAESLKKALVDAVRESKRNFDIAEKRMIESLEEVAQDFESRKVGIKKSTVVIVAFLTLTAGVCGWWLGSNSIQRLHNDQLMKKAQNYDVVVNNYNKLSESDQKVIEKLLF